MAGRELEMNDDVTYFALKSNGQFVPIGTRDELVDEITAYGLTRLTHNGSPVRMEVVEAPPENSSAPSFPQWILTTFGVCAVVGAFTVTKWLWFAIGEF